jgi:magnesium transporter
MGALAHTGSPPGNAVSPQRKGTGKTRIHLTLYNQEKFEEKEPTNIEECFLPSGEGIVTWINIDGLQDADVIEKIVTHYNIHPLVLEDMLNTDQRPKTDDYGDYLFTVMKSLRYDRKAGESAAEQISLVLGPDYVLSLREEESDNFNSVLEQIRKAKGQIRQGGADYLAYALMDSIVDNYFVLFEEMGEKVEDLEEELITDPRPATLQEIHKLKRTLISLRKSVWPLREVIANLEKVDSSRITHTTQIYLRDVYDHTVQVLETLEGYRDMISGMLDIYLSSVSNRLNEVMKVLTIIATLFIPITFLTGVFGMNFKDMTVLSLPFAFPGSLILMACVAASLLIYFKRKGWF